MTPLLCTVCCGMKERELYLDGGPAGSCLLFALHAAHRELIPALLIPGRAEHALEDPALWASAKNPLCSKTIFCLWTMVRCYPRNLLLTVTLVAESEHNFPHLHWGSYLYNSVLESKSFLFFIFLFFFNFAGCCSIRNKIITFVPST